MPVRVKSKLPRVVAELGRLDATIHKGAELLAQYARFRVPVDDGDLRSAIHVEREGVASYHVIAGDQEVFWGHLAEHGTSHSAPRPFLVPAVDDARKTVVGLVAAQLRKL